MNIARHRRKKKEVINHRRTWYLRALDMVFEGRAEPDYATKRWKKLKEAEGKK